MTGAEAYQILYEAGLEEGKDSLNKKIDKDARLKIKKNVGQSMLARYGGIHGDGFDHTKKTAKSAIRSVAKYIQNRGRNLSPSECERFKKAYMPI